MTRFCSDAQAGRRRVNHNIICNKRNFPSSVRRGAPDGTVRSGVVCQTNYYRDYSLRS